MRIIETKFILTKNIELKELGIKFRKIRKKEKDQILNDLHDNYFNNKLLAKAKEYDFNSNKMTIKQMEFWNELDDTNKTICMFNNLLTKDNFKKLNYEETKNKINHMVIIECDETILSEYIDKDKITKFISNLLSLYGIYSSPLEMTEKVRFDYSKILEDNLFDKTSKNYFPDLILNCATSCIANNSEIVSLKYVNISQKYLLDIKQLLETFDKNDIRSFVSSIDLIFTECSSIENRIINLTSIIEKLLISSDENINKSFVLKAGLILKRCLKTKNNSSNNSIKNLLAFSYNIRSCIVHGNENKIIDSLSKLTKKDKSMVKLCKSNNDKYIDKVKNAYNIAEITLYLTLRAVIKYWFDYPSELKYIKLN